MENKKEIYKDDITKLIDGKSLDEIIKNLQSLRKTCNGCEVIKLKLTSNYRPMVAVYDVVNEIPSNFEPRNPKLKTNSSTEVKSITKNYPKFNISELPRNLFIDTKYLKDVYGKEVDGLEEITIINNLKDMFRNTKNRVFVKYGKGKHDIYFDGTIAGFFILNLDSIMTPTVEVLVPNKEQIKFLIGKDGNVAGKFAREINEEFKFVKVRKIFFKEVK